MNGKWSFQRFAALTAIISFLFAMGNIVVTILATPANVSTDVLTDPALALSIGADGVRLMRWGTIFAAVHPPLAAAYAPASAEERATLEIVFGTIANMVYGGMWNILEEILAGIWFLGIGLLLRVERRIFSILSMVLGIAAFLDSFGNILSVQALASVGLYIYLILAPIWALWLGIDLLRRPVQIATA